MKTIATKVLDRLILAVYATRNPSDKEWDDYLRLIEQHGIDRSKQLIATEGGAPTSGQRRRLKELLGGRRVPVAVISRNALVRGSVTGLTWFNSKIQAFPPSGLRDALAHLDITASRAKLIDGELHKLRNELEGQTP